MVLEAKVKAKVIKTQTAKNPSIRPKVSVQGGDWVSIPEIVIPWKPE
jgi:hypothetical protein